MAILVIPAVAFGCSTPDPTDGAAVDTSTDRPSPAMPSAACSNEARSSELQTRLSALVGSLLDDHPDTNGIALHVEAPAVCLSQTFVAGLADPMSGVELDPDHAVRMASNTKTYVAAAILRLVEDGTLGLEDPISKHIAQDNTDALRTGGYDVESITVLHLLSHTSGLYDYATDPLYADAVTGDPAHHWTRTEQLHFALRHGKPYAMPGEEFHYADTGYILLGEIVERVSATPLALALRELIGYERLGLDGTWLETLEPVPAGVTDRAHQFIDEVDTYACDYGLGISAIEDAGVRGWGHNGFWNTFSYHYPDLDATIAGSISQRQAFDVTDVLRREAIATLRD